MKLQRQLLWIGSPCKMYFLPALHLHHEDIAQYIVHSWKHKSQFSKFIEKKPQNNFRKVFKYKMAIGKWIELTCCVGIVLLRASNLLGCKDDGSCSFVSGCTVAEPNFQSQSWVPVLILAACTLWDIGQFFFFILLSFNFLI